MLSGSNNSNALHFSCLPNAKLISNGSDPLFLKTSASLSVSVMYSSHNYDFRLLTSTSQNFFRISLLQLDSPCSQHLRNYRFSDMNYTMHIETSLYIFCHSLEVQKRPSSERGHTKNSLFSLAFMFNVHLPVIYLNA